MHFKNYVCTCAFEFILTKGLYEPSSDAPSEISYGIQCHLNLNIQVFKEYKVA